MHNVLPSFKMFQLSMFSTNTGQFKLPYIQKSKGEGPGKQAGHLRVNI